MALRKSQHHDQQLVELKKSVDALQDVLGGRYAEGNPKNVRSVAWISVRMRIQVYLEMFTTAILTAAVVQRQ